MTIYKNITCMYHMNMYISAVKFKISLNHKKGLVWHKGGGIARLVSHLSLILGTQIWIVVGGLTPDHSNAWRRGEKITGCKIHLFTPVSLTDWCKNDFKKRKKKNVNCFIGCHLRFVQLITVAVIHLFCLDTSNKIGSGKVLENCCLSANTSVLWLFS